MGSEDAAFLLSLCVAAYNAEATLERTLTSIEEACQGVDAEVIVINDGSCDNTQTIAEKMCHKHDAWRVINQKNTGLGGVRDVSFQQARGRYVWCIDGDDTIAPSSVRRLIDTINACGDTTPDIVFIDIARIADGGNIDESSTFLHANSAFDGIPVGRYCHVNDYPQLVTAYPSTCMRVMKKALYQRLSRGYQHHLWYEDLEVAPRILMHAESFMVIDERLYYYWVTQGSIMNNTNVERNGEIMTVLDSIVSYYREYGQLQRHRKELEYLIIEHVLFQAIRRVSHIDKNAPLIKELRTYVKKRVPQWYLNPYFWKMSWRRKIACAAFALGLTSIAKYG